MDFEELQVIWNSQNHEKMYTINEDVLDNYIKNKGKSIGKMLSLSEFILIAVNLVVGIWLTIESLDNNNPSTQSILAVFYLAFVVFSFTRRLIRRNEEKPFDQTIAGELDKAIWRVDYLMRQGKNAIIWYLIPLAAILGVMSFLDTKRLLWAFGFIVVTIVVSYFEYQRENKKIHLPNKRNLEALREKLTAKENQ
jgi:membrane protein insertase Oxa1/YidC/SpoIIIJ